MNKVTVWAFEQKDGKVNAGYWIDGKGGKGIIGKVKDKCPCGKDCIQIEAKAQRWYDIERRGLV